MGAKKTFATNIELDKYIIKIYSYFSPHRNINLRYIMTMKVKVKAIRFLEKNLGGNICDLEV